MLASSPPEQPPAPSRGITRLAPSPTGALHLGNARTFLVNWALAQQHDWHVLMRVEDLDSPRVKAGAEDACLDTLAWLGLTWEEPVTRQSDDLTPYRDAMHILAHQGQVYPSEVTRAQLEASMSAPQEGAHELRCPPDRRPEQIPDHFHDDENNWRFATPTECVDFDDGVRGACSFTPSDEVGDFVVWTKRGQPSYQLAVVVDDARQGVDRVVRGDDLASSTARQILLSRALGLAWSPEWVHLPLVLGADGRRLAKRHGDTRVSTYREAGVRAERLIGLVAFWSGVTENRQEMTAQDFAKNFSLRRMAREPVRFGSEDDEWLRS